MRASFLPSALRLNARWLKLGNDVWKPGSGKLRHWQAAKAQSPHVGQWRRDWSAVPALRGSPILRSYLPGIFPNLDVLWRQFPCPTERRPQQDMVVERYLRDDSAASSTTTRDCLVGPGFPECFPQIIVSAPILFVIFGIEDVLFDQIVARCSPPKVEQPMDASLV